MISRLGYGLLLIIALPAVALSQTRPSHRPVDGSLAENLRPEEALAARLKGSRSLKQMFDGKANQEELRELAKKLMGDQKFMEMLKDKFTGDDAEKLLGAVGRGDEKAGGGEGLQKLLDGINGKNLNEDQKEAVKRLTEGLSKGGGEKKEESDPGERPKPETNPAEPKSEAAPGAPRAEKPEEWKLDPKTEDWLKRNLDRWGKDFEKWASSSNNQGLRDLIKDFTKRYEANKSLAPGLVEKAGGFTKYLPRMSNYLPRPRVSNLPDLPRLPLPSRFGMPSGPSGGALSQGGKVFLWVLAVGVVAFLVWRAGAWTERVRQARAAEWRLGPWPILPNAVTTRGDLVRAFEYLALLRLGRAARTHHHHDLASRIGALPSLDPDRRKDAAETLAEIYEHARYRPDDEPLPDEEIRRARRELCYLAGVTAA